MSFALTEPKGGSYFRVIQTKGTEYVLVIQFPEAIRGKAALGTHSGRQKFFSNLEQVLARID